MNFAPGAWRYAVPPLLAAPFAVIFSVTVSVLALALGAATLAFFRDPDRSPPPTGVVAPADGKVSVLRREGDRVRLGVFMNVWNVHVARAPFSGTVAETEHTPGAHRPAFSKDSDRNERVHVRFAEEADDADNADDGRERAAETDDAGVGGAGIDREITLVAGAFARRIYPYVEPGDRLERGDRIGHIAFGSRVDVVFPPAVDLEDVAVKPGDRVTAGETVILGSGAPMAEAGVDYSSGIDLGADVDGEPNADAGDQDGDANGGEGAWT